MLNKQIESQDSLISEIILLESMSSECKKNISIIQEYIQHSKKNTDQILIMQKQILQEKIQEIQFYMN